ncbi:hypothetical protein MHBO_004350 [Bonamia ostreae]|uniref:F5/8 type C domain-containing protein n=1 Tax=Bonamia ostreae TaxID=126728 RepID=A0ABV2ATA8_9EUKA
MILHVYTELSYLRRYFFYFILAENLSRKNSTIVSQSSTYLTRYANYSNDGKHGTTENECSHTGIGHKKAWFQVDLKEEYSLKSITITYRDEGKKYSYIYTYRYVYRE